MNIIYELNPPKIFYDSTINVNVINREIEKFLNRAQSIIEFSNFIHVTDSVLGIPRISSIHGATIIRDNIKNTDINLSCSVRTRDRNINSLIQFAVQSISTKINDLLFIMGDKPQINNDAFSNVLLSKPTEVITTLNNFGFNNLINLNLSVPNKVSDIKKFVKKTNANPYAMVTQSINSLDEVKDLKKLLESYPIKLIPCVMIPSKKNIQAAKMIGLDWKEYENNLLEFISDIGEFADGILVTSPNDFNEGLATLKKIKNH
jgi:5,10-methylenetetrahydrofolate reductase